MRGVSCDPQHLLQLRLWRLDWLIQVSCPLSHLAILTPQEFKISYRFRNLEAQTVLIESFNVIISATQR